jgi:hypothetical protein
MIGWLKPQAKLAPGLTRNQPEEDGPRYWPNGQLDEPRIRLIVMTSPFLRRWSLVQANRGRDLDV